MTALQFIRVTPRLPDARYWLLHLKCADGSITEDEAAELDLMQAEKVAEYERDMGDCRSGTGAGGSSDPSPSVSAVPALITYRKEFGQ